MLNGVEKLPELGAAMPPVAFANDLSGLHVERCEQRGGAMARIVVRAPFQLSGPHREQWLRAVQCLDLRLLVHAESTSARSGGFRYNPTISRTFSRNSGSLDNLKVSLRCGWRAKARQMRFTVLRLNPDAAASDRVDQ